MTPKEAWQSIKDDIIDYADLIDNGNYSTDEDIKIIDDLVAKAEPMKPLVEIDEHLKSQGYSKLEFADYRCPRCKKYIAFQHYFCPEKDCGQALA